MNSFSATPDQSSLLWHMFEEWPLTEIDYTDLPLSTFLPQTAYIDTSETSDLCKVSSCDIMDTSNALLPENVVSAGPWLDTFTIGGGTTIHIPAMGLHVD